MDGSAWDSYVKVPTDGLCRPNQIKSNKAKSDQKQKRNRYVHLRKRLTNKYTDATIYLTNANKFDIPIGTYLEMREDFLMSSRPTKSRRCAKCNCAYESSQYKTNHPWDRDEVRERYCPSCRQAYHRYVNECYDLDRLAVEAQYGRGSSTKGAGFTNIATIRGG